MLVVQISNVQWISLDTQVIWIQRMQLAPWELKMRN